jgi:hypothetical protein
VNVLEWTLLVIILFVQKMGMKAELQISKSETKMQILTEET